MTGMQIPQGQRRPQGMSPSNTKIAHEPNGMKLGRTHALFHGVSSMGGFPKHLLSVWVNPS
jgi:hypothetical protein